MPTRDIRSNLLPKVAFNANITSSTTTNGAIIDTADYDSGVMYAFMCHAYTDGTYTPVIEHSDDSGMSGAVDVPDENLIGTEAQAVLSAVSASGADLKTIGIIGTKRYVRVKITSATVTTGARIVVTAVVQPEILPVYYP